MKKVILLGDVHGNYHTIYDKLHKGILDDCLLIQVGDFGLGFREKGLEQEEMKSLNKCLKRKKCELLVIRGNHDLPAYWKNSELNQHFNKTYSNITLLPDYYTKVINGKKVLFVGGAISIDRLWRKEGVSYWSGEELDEPRFPITEHDILIAHTCPSRFNVSIKGGNDFIKRCLKEDPNLELDLKRERSIMDHIARASGVKKIWHGHMHNSMDQEIDGVKCRCVNIEEFVEMK